SLAEFVEGEEKLRVINVMGRAAWEEEDIRKKILLISNGLLVPNGQPERTPLDGGTSLYIQSRGDQRKSGSWRWRQPVIKAPTSGSILKTL
ncbi:hypothetical protein KI387_039635, partial [Taxus chinensis]